MSKVKIKINGKTVEVLGDAMICVVMTATNTDKHGGEWAHNGPIIINAADYNVEPVNLEAGISLVRASALAAHSDSSNLEVLVAAGAAKFYLNCAKLIGKDGERVGPLIKLLSVTRHGRALRELDKAERESNRPRRPLLDAIAVRLELYGDHEPVPFETVGEMGLKNLQSQAPAEAPA